MDINCINKCVYQQEGKCTLSRLSHENSFTNAASSSDCPYCTIPGQKM